MSVLSSKETLNKIHQIISMQIELNNSTVENWADKDLDWDTAILVETAEAVDSCSWKWWKKTEDDISNLKIEAIDLLHFLISKLLVSTNKHCESIEQNSSVASVLIHSLILNNLKEEYVDHKYNTEKVIKELKNIAFHCLDNEPLLSMKSLILTFDLLGMNFNEVYFGYMSKNLLNHYRQERGYKDVGEYVKGENNDGYVKNFGSVEDNFVFKKVLEKKSDDQGALDKKEVFDEMDRVVTSYKEAGKLDF